MANSDKGGKLIPTHLVNRILILTLLAGNIPPIFQNQAAQESGTGTVEFLRLYQREDGSWNGPIELVGTEMAPQMLTPPLLVGLLWAGVPIDDPMVVRANQYVSQESAASQRVDTLAWSLLALLLVGEQQKADELGRKLLKIKLSKDGWADYAPDRYREIPSEPAVYPTALALFALAHILPAEAVELQVSPDWLSRQNNRKEGWGNGGYAMETAVATMALRAYGYDTESELALQWLLDHQQIDGSWPEDNRLPGGGQVTSTAWAVIGITLLAGDSSEVIEAGKAYLLAKQKATGLWGANLLTTAFAWSALSLNNQSDPDQVLALGLNYLIRQQQPEGYWTKVEMDEKERQNRAFANSELALSLLRNLASSEFQSQALQDFLLEARQIQDFETTFSVLSTLIASDRDIESASVAAGLDWVLSMQQRDGSWFGNAQLTLEALILLEDAGMDPNMPKLRMALDFISQLIAYQMEPSLVEQYLLVGVPPDDPALLRFRLWLVASQSVSGAIMGELVFSDPEDENFQTTAYYLNLLTKVRVPQDVSDAALAYILGAQMEDGSWDQHFPTTLLTAHYLDQSGLADQAVSKARAWLVTQHNYPGLTNNEMFLWGLYLETVGDISYLPAVGLFRSVDYFEARLLDKDKLLGEKPDGPNLDAIARLLRAILPPPAGLTKEAILMEAQPGEEGFIWLRTKELGPELLGTAAPWFRMIQEYEVAGRHIVIYSYEIPENVTAGSYAAALGDGEQQVTISLRIGSRLQEIWIWVLAVLSLLVLATFAFQKHSWLWKHANRFFYRHSKTLREIVFWGFLWGLMKSNGTYLAIKGGLIAGSQILTYLLAALLIGGGIYWQLRKAQQSDIALAVGASVLAGLLEYGLLKNSAPWPPGSLTLALWGILAWGALLGLSGKLTKRKPKISTIILLFPLIFCVHLFLLSRFFPPYYGKSILSFDIRFFYPLRWYAIPLRSLAAYFYLTIGLTSLVVVSLTVWLVKTADQILHKIEGLRNILREIRAEFRARFVSENALAPGVMLAILFIAPLMVILIGYSEIWLIELFDLSAIVYLLGLLLYLMAEPVLAMRPKALFFLQTNILIWTLAFTISEALIISSADLTDYSFLFDAAGVEPLRIGIILVALTIEWITLLVWEGLAHILGKERLKRWRKSLSKNKRKIMKRIKKKLHKRLPEEVYRCYWKVGKSLDRIGQHISSPKIKSMGQKLGQITVSNLVLNLLLLAGFWLDALGLDIQSLFNTVQLFNWGFSNPFILQFVVLEAAVVLMILGWGFVRTRVD